MEITITKNLIIWLNPFKEWHLYRQVQIGKVYNIYILCFLILYKLKDDKKA